MSAAPAAIITPRSTIAPTMPQNSTRYWNCAGIFMYVKMMAMTKMLSTDSDHSSR